MDDFFRLVTRIFAFLEEKHGFQLMSQERESSLDAIVYEKKPVRIEFGWYKGEIDISFHVDLENGVFRPHVSRAFHLSEVALRQDKQAYQNAPRFPNYITLPAEAETALQFEAVVMKRYCQPILQGDVSILEEMTKKRRSGA